MINIDLPVRIGKLRASKNLSMKVVAKRIGVTISSVSAYENGTRTPSLVTLIKMAHLFNVSIDYLLGNAKDDYVDVTGLTSEQRSMIDEMISDYKELNLLRVSRK
ncbi:MAG: helix-turn-helix transcriptional regulator [Defluviitaleaceae bacterium]|nr:helix-turn-helix transcriptional regulator [Defluviitaleaceae bacterium]MCL2836059.1 helix-turn-helix transcriptional regulator [Defluviitaleaceae bacterium]